LDFNIIVAVGVGVRVGEGDLSDVLAISLNIEGDTSEANNV